ncbi:MAG: PLP-dependent aminotransferase family protein [Deltaproteobacteria bacterium]|nr:PLP-dependent aminotransferase family protein [Deltaproteobacteria bacterium]
MTLLIKLNPKANIPIYRQIMDQIIGLIDTGALKPGAHLPSTRDLAHKLGLNRSTVYRAYQELWALGYVESQPGSYSTVRKRTRIVSGDLPREDGVMDWHQKSTPGGRALYESLAAETTLIRSASGSDLVNFMPLSPDNRLFPLDDFRKCMNQALHEEGTDLLQYGDVLGYGPLRAFIAERMQQHSVSVSTDEILITTGAQGAIELLLHLLTEPGADVALGAPTYSRAIALFRLFKVNMVEVPVGHDGMDLDMLEGLLQKTRPRFVYTIPNFHNPMGITTEQAHRERLLEICEASRVPLVEDGFEEEMKYFGKTVLPIKSMDHRGVVIYLGTFSKVLFPGLRIGWVAADRGCIERLAAIQQAQILSGNLLGQAALTRFCRSGRYDMHIKRMHRIYRKRMQVALKAMKEAYLPNQVLWTRPAGGYTLWIELNGLDMEDETLFRFMADRGILISPGSHHFCNPPDRLGFRISIAHLEETDIQEGISRLGMALWDLYENARRRP